MLAFRAATRRWNLCFLVKQTNKIPRVSTTLPRGGFEAWRRTISAFRGRDWMTGWGARNYLIPRRRRGGSGEEGGWLLTLVRLSLLPHHRKVYATACCVGCAITSAKGERWPFQPPAEGKRVEEGDCGDGGDGVSLWGYGHVQVSKVATRRETQFQPALYGPSQATAKLGRWTSYIVNYIPVWAREEEVIDGGGCVVVWKN